MAHACLLIVNTSRPRVFFSWACISPRHISQLTLTQQICVYCKQQWPASSGHEDIKSSIILPFKKIYNESDKSSLLFFLHHPTITLPSCSFFLQDDKIWAHGRWNKVVAVVDLWRLMAATLQMVWHILPWAVGLPGSGGRGVCACKSTSPRPQLCCCVTQDPDLTKLAVEKDGDALGPAKNWNAAQDALIVTGRLSHGRILISLTTAKIVCRSENELIILTLAVILPLLSLVQPVPHPRDNNSTFNSQPSLEFEFTLALTYTRK